MKMKAKIFTIVLSALLILSACSSNKSSTEESKQQKEITFWMFKSFIDNQNKTIKQLAEQFGKENNVKVNVELIGTTDFTSKRAAAIEANELPDVSYMEYQDIGQYSKLGLLEDLSELAGKIESTNGKMYDNVKKVNTNNGKQYGIPFYSEGNVLYYRKDLLKNAGYDSPPKTWEEFREVAQAVTESTDGKVYGAGIGFSRRNEDSEWMTRALLWSYGADFSKINSPEATEALQLVKNIWSKDKSAPPGALGWDDSGNNKAYLSGQAAMVFNTGSIINAMKTDFPDLIDKTGIAIYPEGPKGRIVPGVSASFGIFKNAENKELGKKLIEYIMDTENYKEYVFAGIPFSTPVYEELANDPIWNDPVYKPFVESSRYYGFLGYPNEYSPKDGVIFNKRLIGISMEQLLGSNATPIETLETLQKSIDEVKVK